MPHYRFKSRFTAAHSSTVAACAKNISKYAGYNEDEQKVIEYAGYIHDLGKLAIPIKLGLSQKKNLH